ncbi:hypothetical protein [Clostridium estertheticum]|uniref:hypothetical protein n=1 Tax=Clostridium estertheticum TaxID=238834 RepID=UPI001C0C0563|nr:hypothetical protein [Clostridium estertheticum]MBU3174633.1 hypothetical protein [Clostridium estertheticum]MBU3187901.1 hypothetical protein [Clostridium estertheticum]
MNKYIYLKKTVLSKQAILLWILLIVGILVLFKIKENLGANNLSIYINSSCLFSYGIIIIEYLLFISIYMNYFRGNYTIIRYLNISELMKVVIKNIIFLTLIFVIVFNIILLIGVKLNYKNILIFKDLKYILFTISIQFLSFLILGFIYLVIFFKTYSVKKSLIPTFIIYMIATMASAKICLYFILPIKANQIEIMNMIRNMLSIHFIFLLYFINKKSKGIELYEK